MLQYPPLKKPRLSVITPSDSHLDTGIRINSHAGVCGLKTVTIEELKDRTNVTDSQLDTEIEETDLLSLAAYFNNIETFPVLLGLSPAEQQDVKYALVLNDMQTAMFLALRLWRKANPDAATYRALVEIVLRMGVNGTAIAEEVCKFLILKCEHCNVCALI